MSLGKDPLVDTQVGPANSEVVTRLAAETPLVATPVSENTPIRTACAQSDVQHRIPTEQLNEATTPNINGNVINNGNGVTNGNGFSLAGANAAPVSVIAASSDTTVSSVPRTEAATTPKVTSNGAAIDHMNMMPNGLPSATPASVAPHGLEGPAKDIINKLANGGGVAPGPGKVRLTNYVSAKKIWEMPKPVRCL